MRTAALALIATVTLAGCGAAAHITGTAGPAASPPSCHAQYEAWKHGPAAKLQAAVKRLQAAGGTGDIPKLERALKAAGKDAAALQSTPAPRCADPKGYERQVLARITAAADNLKAAHGLGGLLLAEGPLKNIKVIEKQLGAELDRTVGKSR
jgi:hypothetical protein